MSRLAEELALALGCPVDVISQEDAPEVLAIAHVEPGCDVRVTLPVPSIGLPLIDDPYVALKYEMLKQLRRRMAQHPLEG